MKSGGAEMLEMTWKKWLKAVPNLDFISTALFHRSSVDPALRANASAITLHYWKSHLEESKSQWYQCLTLVLHDCCPTPSPAFHHGPDSARYRVPAVLLCMLNSQWLHWELRLLDTFQQVLSTSLEWTICHLLASSVNSLAGERWTSSQLTAPAVCAPKHRNERYRERISSPCAPPALSAPCKIIVSVLSTDSNGQSFHHCPISPSNRSCPSEMFLNTQSRFSFA